MIRILHLASFSGNLGDNYSHKGTYSYFEARGLDIEWTRIEIRDFYQGFRHFDEDFIEQINDYDVFWVGGGNYFELWVDSPSGMSVGFSPEQIRRINPSIIFYSLGVDPGQGVPKANLARANAFFASVFEKDKNFVFLRNDGALKNARNYFPDFSDKFHWIVDGGFLVQHVNEAKPKRRILGVNLAQDMPEIRYANVNKGKMEFVRNIARFIDQAIEMGFVDEVRFFNHVYHDVLIHAQVIDKLTESTRRHQMSINEFDKGDEGLSSLIQGYAKCHAILATRFHSSVIALVQRVPVIAINSYVQIENLYNELGLPSQCMKPEDFSELSSEDFKIKLNNLTSELEKQNSAVVSAIESASESLNLLTQHLSNTS